MIAPLLALSLFALQPGGSAEPGATELVVRVAESGFLAVNPTPRPQLLVLRDRSGHAAARMVLPAGGRFQTRFPRGSLDGLELEVVSGRERLSSGGIELGGLAREGFDSVWFERGEGHTHAWGHGDRGFRPLGLSWPGHRGCAEPSGDPASMRHVPVITPTDKPRGDLPPRLERRPLPPI